MSSVEDFISQYMKDAQIAAQQLGFPTSVILAQWINETGSGSSAAFRNQNNYAGVSLHGNIMSFPNKTAGLAGFISRWKEPVYGPTRASIAAAGGMTANPYTAAKAVEQSPWAAGHYGGAGLEQLIASNNLQQYDKGKTFYAVPPGLAAQLRDGGGGTDPGTAGDAGADPTSTDNAADDECILGIPGVDLPGPLNVNGACLVHRSGGRALLGGVSVVAGVLIMMAGLAFIAGSSKTARNLAGTVGALK